MTAFVDRLIALGARWKRQGRARVVVVIKCRGVEIDV